MDKLCADELAVILTELVNSYFKCKRLLNDMKHADNPPYKRKMTR